MKALRGWNRLAAACVLLLAGHAEAVVQPGVVLTWGDNSAGQLGAPGSMTNAVAVAGGGFHSLALTAEGVVTAWGSNSNGQTNVPANLTNIIALAGGAFHSLALRSNGTVVAWGAGSKGETNVPAGLTNAISIAAGYSHNLALTADGRVVAWGLGSSGQTNVPATLTNAVGIASGAYHSLALRRDATVVAWGDNSYGQAKVPLGLTNVVAVGAGFRHSLALRSDGTVVGWGDSLYGQTNTLPDLTNAAQIVVGAYHNVAVRTDGSLVAWGYNSSGQTNIPAGASEIVATAAGFSHNLAITLRPLLSSKPPLSIELGPGSTISLEVAVLSGLPVNCQWYFDAEPISGATGTSLNIDAFDLSKAGAYSVVVSNSYGTNSASSVVRLTNSPVILVDGADVGGGKVTRLDSARITMTSSLPGANIYYTLDGTSPDFRALQYRTNALVLTNSALLRAVAYDSTYAHSAESAPLLVQITPTYVLTTSTPGGGTIQVAPTPVAIGNRYASNQIVTLTATPAAGWSFLHWTGDATGVTQVATVTVQGPTSVEAVFGTLINLVTNGNGRILLDPPTGPYAFGQAVQITAIPEAGAYFFGWAGAATDASNPIGITATDLLSLTALFGDLQTNQVSLTVLPDRGGTVGVEPRAPFYTNGAPVTLTALPGAGFLFSGWEGDASSSINPLGVTLDSSKIIRAIFSQGSASNPPIIVQEPLSRTISPGSSTVLSLSVQGTSPFSYQWRLNGVPLPGATTSAWPLPNLAPAQAGRYDVVVSNPFGSTTSSVTSVSLFGLAMALSPIERVPLLTLDAAPASVFDLEFSPDLVSTNWHPLSRVQVQDSRLYYVDVPQTNAPARFYRAVPR